MASHLCNTDFPPYSVCMLDDFNFLVAGGGGEARTGVPNAIEIFELLPSKKDVAALSVYRFDTDTDTDRRAIMNASITADGDNSCLLATGKDEFCQLYGLKRGVKKEDKKNVKELRKRKSKESDEPEEKDEEDLNKYEIERLKSVQSDFGDPEKYQKVVRFIHEESLLATGGADGYIRVWKYPDLSKKYEIEAHDKEVDDLDVSPNGKQIVSVSRDCDAHIWSTKDGSHSHTLRWNPNKPKKAYRFRSCRYGVVEGDIKKFKLFTIHVPHVRDKTNTQCYITKWDPSTYLAERTVSTGTDVLSSLAVSADGNYLGLGTMSGAVAVYIAFSLQKLKWVNDVHGIFVTGLSFVPLTNRNLPLIGNKDCAVISVSADKQCKMIRVSKRNEYHIIIILLGFLAIIVAFFFWMDHLGIPI